MGACLRVGILVRRDVDLFQGLLQIGHLRLEGFLRGIELEQEEDQCAGDQETEQQQQHRHERAVALQTLVEIVALGLERALQARGRVTPVVVDIADTRDQRDLELLDVLTVLIETGHDPGDLGGLRLEIALEHLTGIRGTLGAARGLSWAGGAVRVGRRGGLAR